MGICCMAQETHTGALYQPRGVGWGERGAAKSLQSCPTLCDPIDGSPTGSPVPGILQARTLEWVAISFSNACKWKVKAKSYQGFPDSSVGKESACSAGDPSWIPRLRRSAKEWIGYPLQYSWASLVAQLVKNPPAMWETWVWSLGWEDPLEKGMATHSCTETCSKWIKNLKTILQRF